MNCVYLFLSQLHAEYDRNCDEYQAHRVLQAFDTAQFIQLTSTSADLAVLAGDLNTEPGDLAYRIIVGVTGLTDAFTEAGEIAQTGTNETLTNSYTNSSLIKNHCEGKRIDYIMYRPSPNVKLDLVKYCLPLPERVPDCSFSYSDHEAVAATLKLEKCETRAPEFDRDSLKAILGECVEVCDAALRRLLTQKRVFWFFSFVLFCLLIATIATDAPFGYAIVYHVLRALLTGALCFTIVMASLWNMIERNAVVAGKLTMEVGLRRVQVKSVQ